VAVSRHVIEQARSHPLRGVLSPLLACFLLGLHLIITNHDAQAASALPPSSWTPDTSAQLTNHSALYQRHGIKSSPPVDDASIAHTTQQILHQARALGLGGKPRPTASITREQQNALHALAQRNRTGLKARFHPRHGTVTLLRSPQVRLRRQAAPATIDAVGAAAAAQRYLHEHRALLKLRAPSETLSLQTQWQDHLKLRHLRYQQRVNDVPVWGQDVYVHMNAQGDVYQFNGSYIADDAVPDPVPAIDALTAVDAVRQALEVPSLAPDTPATLVYYPDVRRGLRLSWRVEARPRISQWFDYFVDAQTGAILHRINRVHRGSVATASGRTLNGETVSFTAWLEQGLYYLIDPTFPLNDVTDTYDPVNQGLNPTGDAIVIDANNTESDLFFVVSQRADSGWDETAVTVANSARIVYDYFLDVHGRNSLDDNNMNVQSIIHFGEDIANAFWNGQFMVYGDGDGRILDSLAKCLDVAAHEMTHGVIQHSANLIYENQSGALNESFADVFAMLIDDDNWLLGGDCTLARPGYTRSLEDPNTGLVYQPKHVDDYRNLPNTEEGDFGGVHINSGIPNHAFYRVAEAIGRPNAGRIYYRALTTYLTSSSVFVDARDALEQAATDLFGASSAERQAVSDAWDAVGVSSTSAGQTNPTSPTTTAPVNGDDVLVYLRPNDASRETFDLYRQTVDAPFSGYQAGNDAGPLNSTAALRAVPSVFTLENGTHIAYLGTDGNLYLIEPGENARDIALSSTGAVRSAAFSPNGNLVAFTIAGRGEQIHVLDVGAESTTSYTVELPNFQQSETSGAAQVRLVDSLSFDYASEKLIFDVLVCTPLPNSPVSNDLNSGYNYWTVGTLDVVNAGKLSFPFPGQSPLVSLGYPRFASNNSFIAVLDVVVFDDTTQTYDAGAYTYNFETQQLNPVAQLRRLNQPFFTIPSFWGNDESVTFLSPDFSQDLVVPAVIAVDADGVGTGTPTTLNPNYTSFPTMHRIGVRTLNRDLEISASALDFGDVTEGESARQTLMLTNRGNSDVEITDIRTSTAFFTHNASNGRLAQGATLEMTVTFTPSSFANYDDQLFINSNGTPSSLSISLSGRNPGGSGQVDETGEESGSSGGGGGSVTMLLALLMLSVFGRRQGRARGSSA